MNTSMDPTPDSTPGTPMNPPSIPPKARPLYWSIRREVWENRFLYIAPLTVAAVAFLGFLVSTIGLPGRRRAVMLLDLAQQRAAIDKPYDFLAGLLILTAFVVGVFYCLDALHGERRDRSILFWKSLPVSDLTTVLSKISIPLLVLPLISFCIIVPTQLLMLLWTDILLLMHGLPVTTMEQLPLYQDTLILIYGQAVLALWHAPVYAWMLLVSVWARRATFLWAVLPLILIQILEKIAFGTAYFTSLLKYRLVGHLGEAFTFSTHGSLHSLSQLTPVRFLATPGLWIGLAFAALLIAGAVQLRRNREPI